MGNLFLYALVGVSEEVYFRGILPYYLKKQFSARATVGIAVLFFGFGHLSAALSGMNGIETLLTVVNALLFGWLAMEMTRISDNLLPAIGVHFLFDFETKVVVLTGRQLLLAEMVRGVILCLLALWLTGFACKHKKEFVG